MRSPRPGRSLSSEETRFEKLRRRCVAVVVVGALVGDVGAGVAVAAGGGDGCRSDYEALKWQKDQNVGSSWSCKGSQPRPPCRRMGHPSHF